MGDVHKVLVSITMLQGKRNAGIKKMVQLLNVIFLLTTVLRVKGLTPHHGKLKSRKSTPSNQRLSLMGFTVSKNKNAQRMRLVPPDASKKDFGGVIIGTLFLNSRGKDIDDEDAIVNVDSRFPRPASTNISYVASTDINENSNKNNAWIWTVILPLWFVYISNQWSRSSIYYLVNFDTSSTTTTSSALAITAMNVDIGFDQTQYGILASVAFTSLFAISSLGAGYISDRVNRKILTLVAVIGWTIATYGTATSTTYESVVLWRIAMGFACAFSTPTAYTFIRDNVPTTRQATASSLYGTGVAIGSGLASYTLVLDNTYGWRQALNIIASAGLASALMILTLLPDDNKTKPKETISSQNFEGNSGQSEQPFVKSIASDIKSCFDTDRARWIFMGSFVRFCSGLCIGVWGAPYFRMTFADRVNDYAYAQATISAIGASVSGIAGGAIADKLSSSSKKVNVTNNDAIEPMSAIIEYDLIGRRLWVPIAGSLLAAPTWYMAMHTPDSFETSMAWLASEYLVAECWFGPTISALQSTVETRVGGTAQGLFTLTGAIANFAPSILGYFYGQALSSGMQGNEGSSIELANLLTWAVCFGYVANAFCFSMAAGANPHNPIDSTKPSKF